ncbi:MAG TPA: hypothetical protein VD731_00445 [Nitrosopumilaceae archaeon]|nr:hypothetical protein [Nitrosopumilaceae archaeon]
MDLDEQIQAHILSVWKEGKKLLSLHGTEGMLILTDKHLIFINKTEAKMRWWNAVTQRQVLTFLKSNDVMIRQDGYNEEQLRIDLENKKNLEIKFDDILDISHEDKTWGSILNLEINKENKKEKYQFSVVQDWVKYPIKSPTKYMKVDWSAFIQYIKDRQKITN